MISSRKPVNATDIAVRTVSVAASLFMIGALVGCGQSGRPTGGSTPTGTPTPTPSETGAGGGSGIEPSTGGAGSVTIPSTGSAGSVTIPSTGGAGAGSTPIGPITPVAVSCDKASTPGAAPTAFVSECSSCHGMTADGRNGYPTLRRADMTLAEMTAIVRTGKTSATLNTTTAQGKNIPLKMPAFSMARISDGEIAAIFAYRGTPTAANAPVPATYCLTRPEATWTTDQVTEAYTRGLKAWRTAGDVDQNACVSCHAS